MTKFYFFITKVKLFNNIKALFVNKPIILVANKVDIKKIEELPAEKKVRIDINLKENMMEKKGL